MRLRNERNIEMLSDCYQVYMIAEKQKYIFYDFFLSHLSSPFQLPLMGLSPLNTLLCALSQLLGNTALISSNTEVLEWFVCRHWHFSSICTCNRTWPIPSSTTKFLSYQSEGNLKLKKEKRLDSELLE